MNDSRVNPPHDRARRAASVASLLSIPVCLVFLGCNRASPFNGETETTSDDAPEMHEGEVVLSPEAITASGIVVEAVRRVALEPSFTAPARISFNLERTAHVGSQLRGRVSELAAKLGQEVRKGDVLLVVESPDLGEAQSELLARLSAVESARPAVALARAAHERAKAVHEGIQGIALAEVKRREAELRAAEAALIAAESAASVAKNRLRLFGQDEASISALETTRTIDPKAVVRAPIDGTIIEREVTIGELVGPDRDALLVLANMETLWVLASVPESRLPDVEVGARVLVEMGLGEGERFEGVVSYISPTSEPSTRSSEVRIEVQHVHCVLRPGSFARAEITATSHGHREPTLVVLDGAIQTMAGRPVVFVPVEGEEGTFAVRPIERGPAVGDLVPILSGLAEGELVVVRGSFILKAELGKSEAEHVH